MQEIKCWHIGEWGEVYAGYSEEDVKNYLRKQVGEVEAEEAIASLFVPISEDEMDRVVEDEMGGKFSWRGIYSNQKRSRTSVSNWNKLPVNC